MFDHARRRHVSQADDFLPFPDALLRFSLTLFSPSSVCSSRIPFAWLFSLPLLFLSSPREFAKVSERCCDTETPSICVRLPLPPFPIVKRERKVQRAVVCYFFLESRIGDNYICVIACFLFFSLIACNRSRIALFVAILVSTSHDFRLNLSKFVLIETEKEER